MGENERWLKIGFFGLILALPVFGQSSGQINAGPPPEVIPPSDKCTCSWTEWINEDKPQDDDGKICIFIFRAYDPRSFQFHTKIWLLNLPQNLASEFGSKIWPLNLAPKSGL